VTDPRDDFGVFEGSEHMFFGLDRPFAVLREELESMFRQQVPSSRLNAIVADGEPKFLSLGRRLEDDEDKLIVTHYAVCFQSTIDVEADDHREPELRCTMTIAFGDIDRPGEQRMQAWMDVHADADPAFEDEAFKSKFLAFRYGDEA
jgi:hypothetical protein